MNVAQALREKVGAHADVRLNDVDVAPEEIRAMLISEVAPGDPAQDFYAGGQYAADALAMLRRAGIEVQDLHDALRRGIYLTNAAKQPKQGYAVEKATVETSLPYLEAEIGLFPRLRVILLMGDVARRMVCRIARKTAGRNPIPAGATYRLRGQDFRFGEIRLMPSYIITGGNLLIEKSKVAMITEDLAAMAEIIR